MSSYEERCKNLIEDNVNVSSSNDGKDFLILLAGIAGLIICIIVFATTIANCFINIMPDKTQMKIENLFGEMPVEKATMNRYEHTIKNLENIKQNIIANDTSLKTKSKFPLRVIKNPDINAWIVPNGTIYFTTALLDDNLKNEELTFILAHEIGHYKHRDHLKGISKNLIIGLCSLIFATEGNTALNSIAKNVTTVEGLTYSRGQEKAADLYAKSILLKLYGTSAGAVEFMQRIEKKSQLPAFLHYFSTHPSPTDRIKYLQ